MSLRSPRSALRVGLLLACAAHASCGASPDYTAEDLEAATAQLRDHVRLRTFETGLLFGEGWVARAPDDAELRALYARQLAGWRLSREIREQADAVFTDDPDSPWGLHIQALGHLAGSDWDPAVEPSRRAWEALPLPEFAATYLQVLGYSDFEAAFDFLETLDAETRDTPELFAARAALENQARYRREDPAWADSSLATYTEMRERWPDHVDGYLRPAEDLFRANRSEEALPLIEQAVALSPGSVDVRQWHWWILFESEVLPADERRPAVEASIAEFQDAAPESVRGFSALAAMYRDLEDEQRARELEAAIVERDPTSRHASLVYLRQARAPSQELRRIREDHGEDSPEYRAQLEVVRDAVYEYLERPHYDDTYLGGAYIDLFYALQDMDPIPAEELAEAVRGLVEYERLNPHITYGTALRAMIDHTPYAEEAAELARNGLTASIDYVRRLRSIFDTEGELEQAARGSLSGVYDGMGWAYFKAGRIEDARHTLERALVLSENGQARFHVGQVYEHLAAEAEEREDEEQAVEWLDRAEDFYIAGFGGTRGENLNEAALEALYERRRGTRDGIEEYLATLDERDRIRRRERILESRVEAAGTYESFQLARLDGDFVDSADLEGKIAVLHFWGTWCGPCIAEMPGYQKFDARYRDDPEVAVLSISNDKATDVIEEYLAKNNFNFTVLVDDGYVNRSGVSAWPTTWFVDREGYVQFVKIGSTMKLDEEFSWRVEAIREDTGTP
ncbi:redoxin domain-containing protein [Candidatus Palauibacter sp.]|uniref:redoxin domain-containing protein n=1 Tax=Candidatus Palauibacter sp. TaxID=3101350 RepID=UPI003AF1F362